MNTISHPLPGHASLRARLGSLKSWIERQMDDTSRDYESILQDVLNRVEDLMLDAPDSPGRKPADPRLAPVPVPPGVVERLHLHAARELAVPLRELVGGSRVSRVCTARHLVWYLLRKRYGLTWMEIGRQVKRNHTSVLHGVNCARKQLLKHPELQRKLANIEGAVFPEKPARAIAAQMKGGRRG